VALRPRLPRVTPFVRGDDVQPRGEADRGTADERMGEAHAGEIRVGVRPHEDSNLILRPEKRGDRVAQRGRLPRPDALRSLGSETGVDRRLEPADEPAADES